MFLSDEMKRMMLTGRMRGPDSPFVINEDSASPSVRVRFDSIRFHTIGKVELIYKGVVVGRMQSPIPLSHGSDVLVKGIEGTTAFQFDT